MSYNILLIVYLEAIIRTIFFVLISIKYIALLFYSTLSIGTMEYSESTSPSTGR